MREISRQHEAGLLHLAERRISLRKALLTVLLALAGMLGMITAATFVQPTTMPMRRPATGRNRWN